MPAFFGGEGLDQNGMTLFLINILLTAMLIFLVGRRWGTGASIAMGAGAIVDGLATFGMYPLLAAGQLPFAGFPIPITVSLVYYSAQLAIWVNCIVIGLLFAMAHRTLVARLAH